MQRAACPQAISNPHCKGVSAVPGSGPCPDIPQVERGVRGVNSVATCLLSRCFTTSPQHWSSPVAVASPDAPAAPASAPTTASACSQAASASTVVPATSPGSVSAAAPDDSYVVYHTMYNSLCTQDETVQCSAVQLQLLFPQQLILHRLLQCCVVLC